MALVLVSSLVQAFESHHRRASEWLDPNGRGYFGCGPHHVKLAAEIETLLKSLGYALVFSYESGRHEACFDVALARENGVPECFWPEGARAEYEDRHHGLAADAFDSEDVELHDRAALGLLPLREVA